MKKCRRILRIISPKTFRICANSVSGLYASKSSLPFAHRFQSSVLLCFCCCAHTCVGLIRFMTAFIKRQQRRLTTLPTSLSVLNFHYTSVVTDVTLWNVDGVASEHLSHLPSAVSCNPSEWWTICRRRPSCYSPRHYDGPNIQPYLNTNC